MKLSGEAQHLELDLVDDVQRAHQRGAPHSLAHFGHEQLLFNVVQTASAFAVRLIVPVEELNTVMASTTQSDRTQQARFAFTVP